MQYRTAALDDLSQIVAIYNATIASRRVTADLEPVSVPDRLPWFHEHAASTHPLWVADAVDGGSGIAGWLSFSAFHNRAAYRHTAEISIYIREDQRRKGVGGFLLGEAIARAPALGFSALVGLIFGHNTASLALFSAFGFAQWGYLPRVARLDAVERDLVIVGRAL